MAFPLVVLISGTGSNLQAIIDAHARGELPVEIRAVVSNDPRAPGLERARRAGIPALAVDHTQYASREQFDAALQAAIDRFAPQLVVLAGFMRILTPGFVAHYAGRLINVHPSLLPKYRGLNTHQRAIDAGDAEHGTSIHYVTTELDGGPIVLQARVPIVPGDTAQTLRARVQEQEHRIYPLAIRWIAEGRLQWRDERAYCDGKELTAPIQYSFH
jgi:phosphoribosylglycinamide formyltransferase-1